MVGTRALHELLVRAATNHTRLILVGDPRQLPEIDAGGLFAQLARQLPTLTLATNRRQREQWERAALRDLRTGHIDAALRAYAAHDRVTMGDDLPAALQRCVGDWHADYQSVGNAVMLASRRSDVEALNRLARVAVERAGQLSGLPLVVGDRDYRVGDEIVCLRNNQKLELTNGTRGTITAIDRQTRTVTITTTTGEERTVTRRYLDNGHLSHAHALTVHKAQGLTAERVFALIGNDAYRELAYTALSRGRTTNRLYIARDAEGIDASTIADLTTSLQLSRAQHLATQHASPRGPQRSLELGL
jgi:ATP-dependent exoDNAse (exonuclease V) alpha subunit